MKRRLACLLALIVLCGLIVVGRADDYPPGDQPVGNDFIAPGLDLETQLQKDLYCRRPVEFSFVKRVVERVEAGTLPRSLVVTTYGWAREKPTKRIQYFEFALRTRAKKMGLSLQGLEIGGVGLARGITGSPIRD